MRMKSIKKIIKEKKKRIPQGFSLNCILGRQRSYRCLKDPASPQSTYAGSLETPGQLSLWFLRLSVSPSVQLYLAIQLMKKNLKFDVRGTWISISG